MSGEDLSKLKIDKTAASAPISRRRKPWVKAVVALLVLLALVAGGRALLSPTVEVETATVSQVYLSQGFTLLNASGYVVAQRKAAVAAKITGQLEWLGVEEGSRVKAGQVMARLESKDAASSRDQAAANVVTSRHTLEQAQAELADATLAYNRQKELINQGIVARSDFDTAEARYRKAKAGTAAAESSLKGAQASLRGAEVNLDYSLIRAPFDAVVLTKNADVGDIVTPIGAAANAKAAVVSIADMGSLLVEADVSESNLAQIKVGQPCEIQLDSLPALRFRGQVHMIVPTADRSKATVMTKIRFLDQDSRILPEMSAKVAFLSRPVAEAEKSPRIAVNPAAVSSRGGKKLLYVIKDNRVVETPVTLGEKVGDLVEVLSGAKAGEKIALKPLEKLKNGTRIKTAEK